MFIETMQKKVSTTDEMTTSHLPKAPQERSPILA